MRILGLDTSGKTASVAIMDTEKQILLGEHTVYTNRTHSQVIMPMCKNLLNDCNLTLKDIDCMAVAVGPGSYTGLRIGIAAVQGMAMAENKPCIGVSTLEAMASRLYSVPAVLSVMYARSDLFYSAVFQDERITDDELLHVSEIADLIAQYDSIVLTGDGAEEFIRQYAELNVKPIQFRLAPANLRLQSASGVCLSASRHQAGSAFNLTASYLQAVQIQKKKTDK